MQSDVDGNEPPSLNCGMTANSPKIIIGIDPGSRVTGFGVLRVQGDQMIHVSHGVIQLSVEKSFTERLFELGESLRELFAKYHPDEIAIEKIFLGKNADSAFKLGHARGVAMYEGRIANAEVYEYATRLVKKGVTGSGAATKEDVQFVLQRLLNLKVIAKLDASDALALAAYHGRQMQNNYRIKTMGREL